MHEVRSDPDANCAEQHAANRPGGDARRSFARGRTLKDIARITPVVLEDPREIGVSGTHPRDMPLAQPVLVGLAGGWIHDIRPVLPIAVAHQHGDRRSQSFARANAGEELDAIGFDLHATPATVALLPTRELGIDIGYEQR